MNLNNGCIQYNSSNCNSFIGSAGIMGFDSKGNAVMMFMNPENSGVAAYITRVTFTNLSGDPIRIDAISLACIDTKLTDTEIVVTRDLGCIEFSKPKCKILTGQDAKATGGYDVAILSLRPYETQGGPIEDAIILPPGTNRIFIFESLSKVGFSEVSVTTHWVEEKV